MIAALRLFAMMMTKTISAIRLSSLPCSFFCPAWREGRDFQFAGKTAQKLDAVSQGKLD
jgi:hypothetical protein